jgi:hypothetical protein
MSRGVARYKSTVPTSKKTKKTNWLLLFVETMSPLTGNHTKHINVLLHSADGIDFMADVIKWLIKNSDSFYLYTLFSKKKCVTNFYNCKNIRNIIL